MLQVLLSLRVQTLTAHSTLNTQGPTLSLTALQSHGCRGMNTPPPSLHIPRPLVLGSFALRDFDGVIDATEEEVSAVHLALHLTSLSPLAPPSPLQAPSPSHTWVWMH